MRHSPLNAMEILETKHIIPKGFELGITLSLPIWSTYVVWRQGITIGHFRITFGLFFKVSPGAHLFMWKLVFICMWMKTYFIWKMGTRTRFEKEAKGNRPLSKIPYYSLFVLQILHKHCFHFPPDLLSQEKIKTMLMQNFGRQTKSIMVFLKVAYSEMAYARPGIAQAWERTVIRQCYLTITLGENRKTSSGPKQGWNLRPYDFWLGNSTTAICEVTAIIPSSCGKCCSLFLVVTWRHGGHVCVQNSSEKRSLGNLILLLLSIVIINIIWLYY